MTAMPSDTTTLPAIETDRQETPMKRANIVFVLSADHAAHARVQEHVRAIRTSS